jgi:RNA polymerase sigma-70 factor (ECF subfamily)
LFVPQPSELDRVLVERVRRGQSQAWSELIARFEGRLLAFVESRLRSRAASEDVVQETFVGFLTSLPHYDGQRPLESYLFSIAAHKLTDHLRREGRRPMVSLASESNDSSDWDMPAPDRVASSLARSAERRRIEEAALVRALEDQIQRWKKRGDWEKLTCAELLFVRGLANKEVAHTLAISEQTVANHKFEFLARLKTQLRRQGLSADVFPELATSEG